MKLLKLGTFTVEALGVHHPDYFQGYGTSGSGYPHSTYGIGDTEEAALDDCLENLAQGVDFDDDTEQAVRDEYGHADDNVTAIDHIDCEALDEYPDHKCPECHNDISDIEFGDTCAVCGKEFDYPEHTPYFHIGIKWNSREEDRLNRIKNLPGADPLRYADYCAVDSDSDDYPTTWGEVTRLDGSGSCGDFKPADWPESAASYVNGLSDDILESGELYFYVPYASGSDYSGSTVEAANYKCIVETFGENDWIHEVYGGHGTYAAAIGVTGLLNSDEDSFEEFCEIIEGLADYPLIDEDMLCQLESDATDEAWNSWGSDDFTRALEKACDGDPDFIWPDDDEFRAFFQECAESASEYWYNEGSGSDMYIDIDKVVESIDFDDYSKWIVRHRVSYIDVGEVCEYFTDEGEAINRVWQLRDEGFIGADYSTIEPAITVKA